MTPQDTPQKPLRKPEWLKISIAANERYTETKHIVEAHRLHTICSSGRCPNLGECWGRGTATFMIGGDTCTRSCRFCNTKTGRPLPLDPDEPEHVADLDEDEVEQLSHVIQEEIGQVFAQVLEDCAVFADNLEGRKAFARFIDSVQ